MTGGGGVDPDELACREFVELVTDYLEGQLDMTTRARFEAHLAECPGCENYLEQIRTSAQALGQVSLDPLSAGARAELLSAFRSWSAARSVDS